MRAWRLGISVGLMVVATSAGAKRPVQPGFAEPGDIIAAEGDFAHLSAAKGVKTAIHATSAIDAEIFAPQLLRVASYAVPNALAQWHTRQLWMSCDGSVAVTYGQWQQGPAIGWYSAVWKRQKGGVYKWVLEQGGALAAPLVESDMIAAIVADCPARRPQVLVAPESGKAPPADYTAGHADDRTLEWATDVAGDGTRSFVVTVKQDAVLHEVLRATAQPGG